MPASIFWLPNKAQLSDSYQCVCYQTHTPQYHCYPAAPAFICVLVRAQSACFCLMTCLRSWVFVEQAWIISASSTSSHHTLPVPPVLRCLRVSHAYVSHTPLTSHSSSPHVLSLSMSHVNPPSPHPAHYLHQQARPGGPAPSDHTARQLLCVTALFNGSTLIQFNWWLN